MSLRQFVPAEPKRKRDHAMVTRASKLMEAKRTEPKMDIFNACIYGNLEAVKWYIKYADYSRKIRRWNYGNHINCSDRWGFTPLYKACEKGNINVVRLLLTAPGIDPNGSTKPNANTPLRIACQEGHAEVVSLLLANPRVDVNQANSRGEAPLFIATQSKHAEVVKLLLAAPGIDVNQADNDGTTPLHLASQENLTEIFKLLLAAGADPNQADNDGKTPLFIASQYMHAGVVSLLLNAGADPNQDTGYDETPLWHASRNGDVEVVKLLLAAPGIDVNKGTTGYYASTPLYEACQIGSEFRMLQRLMNQVEVVKLLLAAPGIDANQTDRDGATVLYNASREGHVRIVEALLANEGVDVNKANNNGETPLYGACRQNSVNVVGALLAAGADPNQADNDGNTPLHSACKYGYFHDENRDRKYRYLHPDNKNLGIVKRLLKVQDIDPNKRNNVNLTPLMMAAFNNLTNIALILMDDPRVEFEDSATMRASEFARLGGAGRLAGRMDDHRRMKDRMTRRVMLRPVDQGQAGHKPAGDGVVRHIREFVGHHKKTKLKF